MRRLAPLTRALRHRQWVEHGQRRLGMTTDELLPLMLESTGSFAALNAGEKQDYREIVLLRAPLRMEEPHEG